MKTDGRICIAVLSYGKKLCDGKGNAVELHDMTRVINVLISSAFY